MTMMSNETFAAHMAASAASAAATRAWLEAKTTENLLALEREFWASAPTDADWTSAVSWVSAKTGLSFLFVMDWRESLVWKSE